VAKTVVTAAQMEVEEILAVGAAKAATEGVAERAERAAVAASAASMESQSEIHQQKHLLPPKRMDPRTHPS